MPIEKAALEKFGNDKFFNSTLNKNLLNGEKLWNVSKNIVGEFFLNY